jgi:hypothetical protein
VGKVGMAVICRIDVIAGNRIIKITAIKQIIVQTIYGNTKSMKTETKMTRYKFL